MRSLSTFVLTLALLPLSAVAGGVFPSQPAPMSPGYGANGAGLHSAIPYGEPGEDCLINPVSMTRGTKEVVVTRLVAGDVVSVPALVLFEFDRDEVRKTGVTELANIYNLLDEAGVSELRIVGHTDSKGSEEYNQQLGFRRAAAVALTLEGLGLDVDELVVDSAGELQPVAPNTNPDGSDNPEGRQQNRRVEFEVVAVRDREIESTEVAVFERNPQVFHVMSNNHVVGCGLDRQNRLPLLWNNGYRSHNHDFLRFPY